MKIWSLDVETRDLDSRIIDYAALEPWRLRQGKAEISSVAVCRPDDSVRQVVNTGQKNWPKQVSELLRSLAGQRIFGHFAIFDVAWLIATLQPEKFKPIPSEILAIKWADTSLLVKWLINGQKPEDANFSYSLANLVETFLPDHPMTEEFVKMKSQNVRAGEDEGYWQTRGELDVIMTRALAEELMTKVPESMQIGLMTEWADIVPIANAWVNGIKIDHNQIERVEYKIDAQMFAATKIAGVEGTVISSPKQLGNLLFNQWGIRPRSYTPTGQTGTSGDDLKWIHYEIQDKESELARKMDSIMVYKTQKTLKSKYIDTLKMALSHTNDGYIYGVPRLFGTYTGRMTYANTTKKDGPKVSIALHQLPRKNKEIRELLLAPEGFGVIEVDASGQESRLMAIRSGDPVMLEIFKRELNFHSMTAAAIIGMEYEEFQSKFEGSKSGYFVEQRQLGKLTNLSCNFRIGGRALAEKAFTEYDTYMTEETGRFLVNTFARQYAMVPQYWRDVIRTTIRDGYTETFSGRRYKIHKWEEKYRWMSESSAINVPIQGSGADMKEIAISVIMNTTPEAMFSLDLHDAGFFFAPLQSIEEIKADILQTLNDIDYEAFWGREIPIPLTYEGGSGLNFGEVK